MFTVENIEEYLRENESWEIVSDPRPGTVRYQVYIKPDAEQGYALISKGEKDGTAVAFSSDTTIYDIARDIVEYQSDMDVYGYFAGSPDDDWIEEIGEELKWEYPSSYIAYGSKMMFESFYNAVADLVDQISAWLEDQGVEDTEDED